MLSVKREPTNAIALAWMLIVFSACRADCPPGTNQVNGVCQRQTNPWGGDGGGNVMQPVDASLSDGGKTQSSGGTGSSTMGVTGVTPSSPSTAGTMGMPAATSSTNASGAGGAQGPANTAMSPVTPTAAGAGSTAIPGSSPTVAMAGAGMGAISTQPMSPSCIPTTEICDGSADEDCDGVPDAMDPDCECLNGAMDVCVAGKGICADGKKTCSDGKWGACVSEKQPQTEICDGRPIDEDCDGDNNTGCDCVNGSSRPCPGASSVGECSAGTQSCNNGQWGACQNKVDPKSETCNGRDDDCNGPIDDGVQCSGGSECKTAVCNGASGCGFKMVATNTPCQGVNVCDGKGSCITPPSPLMVDASSRGGYYHVTVAPGYRVAVSAGFNNAVMQTITISGGGSCSLTGITNDVKTCSIPANPNNSISLDISGPGAQNCSAQTPIYGSTLSLGFEDVAIGMEPNRTCNNPTVNLSTSR
jgi:hypothetical protein